MRRTALLVSLFVGLTLAEAPVRAQAGTQATPAGGEARPAASALGALKAQIEALKADYEKRIRQLESQVEELQAQMLRATSEPEPAVAAPSAERAPSIPGAFNPAIAVVGNFVARADSQKAFSEDGIRLDNRFNFREAEIDLRVPVDPYADGVLITAFGSDVPGSYSANVEEGYVNLKKLPFSDSMPLGLRFRAGRFRPAFGKNNLLHTHDLPQTLRPLPLEEFLGEEGFIQSGVSGSFFIPTPWDQKSSLDLTLQALTGGDIAISPAPGSRVSYLGHLRWFWTFADSHDIELGWSSYARPAGNGSRGVNLQGADLTYRWKPLRQGEWKSFLLGTELFFAGRPYPEAAGASLIPAPARLDPGRGKPFGFTVFSQWQFDRRKYAGLRFDETDTVATPELQRRGITPYFSYYFSEFLRFRLNYERRWGDLSAENRRNSVFAELNFVFGAHPPEPFWVNK